MDKHRKIKKVMKISELSTYKENRAKKIVKKHFIRNLLKLDKVKKVGSKARESFSRITDIPSYIVSSSTKITIIDNNSILIEGYKNIAECLDSYIKLSCNSMEVVIDGKNLKIGEMTDEDFIVSGEIVSINFGK